MFTSYQKVMLGELNGKTNTFTEIDNMDKWVLIPIVILIFALGIYPSFITNLSEQSVQDIINIYKTKIGVSI